MAFPDDKFLPVKSVFADTPISGDIKFYTIDDLQLDGISLMISERRNTVNLTRKRLLKLKALGNSGGGEIAVDGSRIVVTEQKARAFYVANTTLQANANAGSTFVSWSGDVTSTSNPLTIPSTDIVTLYANFKVTGQPDPTLATGTISPLREGGFCVDDLRTGLEDCITSYVTTPLEGASTVTNWTKTTVLAAISGGVANNWTRIPSRNHYGLTASGASGIPRGTQCWKEHINELFDVCRKLTHIAVRIAFSGSLPTVISGATKQTGASNTGSYSETDCNTSISCIESHHPGNSYGNKRLVSYGGACAIQSDTSLSAPDRIQIRSTDGGNSTGTPQLLNQRGKIRCNLSAYAVGLGTVEAYLKLTYPDAAHPSNNEFLYGQTRPNSSAVNTFGAWSGHGMVLGVTTDSNLLGDVDAVFHSGDICPTSGFGDVGNPLTNSGWKLNDGYCVIVPTFTYA